MHKTLLSFTALLLSGTIAVAQQMPMPMNADGLKWGPVPNVFPPGAQIAVVSGDPFKEGLYVVRLKMPAGYKILRRTAIRRPNTSRCCRARSTSAWATSSTSRRAWRCGPAGLPRRRPR